MDVVEAACPDDIDDASNSSTTVVVMVKKDGCQVVVAVKAVATVKARPREAHTRTRLKHTPKYSTLRNTTSNILVDLQYT